MVNCLVNIVAGIAITTICLSFTSSMAGERPVRYYELVPAGIVEADSDPPYVLPDHDVNSIPPALFGLRLVEDEIFLCDEITSSLIKLDRHGQEIFAVGSRGEGPEDHGGTGEPILWPGCAVARSDCTVSPKLVCYDEQGRFLHEIRIEGFHQYLRIVRGGTRGFGLAMIHRQLAERDFLIRIFLASIADTGTLVDSLLVKEHRMSLAGGRRPREEDFEVTPRLECDGAGRLYLQRDMYVWDIECLDEDLKRIWRLHREVDPLPRTEDEIAKARRPGLVPATHRHVIRRIVPRSGGEVWVQTTREDVSPGELHLERFDHLGRQSGEVVITGLPETKGEISIEGYRAIWKRDDDVMVLNEEPYIVVFDLISRP